VSDVVESSVTARVPVCQRAHETALADLQAIAGALEFRVRAISTRRALLALGMVVAIGAIVFAHLPASAWLLVVALGVAFAGHVVMHSRVFAQRHATRVAARFHERQLGRRNGTWRTFASTGARYASDDHPYASDLDVFGPASLFQLIDATCTRIGADTLASWLSGQDAEASSRKSPESRATLVERQQAVKELALRIDLREAIALLDSESDDDKLDARDLRAWTASMQVSSDSAEPSQDRARARLVVAAAGVPALALCAGGLAAAHVVPWSVLLGVYGLGFVLSLALAPRVQPQLAAASSKHGGWNAYAAVFARLESETFSSPRLRHLQAALSATGLSASRELTTLGTIMSYVEARNNDVFRIFVSPLLMWDAWCALALDRWRKRVGASAWGWLVALGEIEALASLGGFTFLRPDHVFPDFSDEPQFSARSLAHPLIDEEYIGSSSDVFDASVSREHERAHGSDSEPESPRDGASVESKPRGAVRAGDSHTRRTRRTRRVGNDVRLDASTLALVVTGSNMSGKSTLLRAIGLNAVLANAGAPVCAESLTLGPAPLVVATSMRVSDSLEHGVSRFYAELQKLRRVLELARRAQQQQQQQQQGERGQRAQVVLFLLDEILHGTNTRERLIGARAIVRELVALGAIGAVSTHDLALGDLADAQGSRVRNVHFEEQVSGDVMTFDYRLREGVVQSSNALRLMQSVGLLDAATTQDDG